MDRPFLQNISNERKQMAHWSWFSQCTLFADPVNTEFAQQNSKVEFLQTNPSLKVHEFVCLCAFSCIVRVLCAFACACELVGVCVCVSLRACTYLYLYVYVQVRVCICVYGCVRVCMRTSIWDPKSIHLWACLSVRKAKGGRVNPPISPSVSQAENHPNVDAHRSPRGIYNQLNFQFYFIRGY